MQDDIHTVVRGMLAEAFRDLAAVLDGDGARPCTSWPKLKVADGATDASKGYGSATVYMAGCSALSGLAQRLQIPIFKIGATQQPLLTRQSDLCADRYGAAIRRGGKLVAEAGFHDWEMRRLDPIDVAGSHIEFVPRALRVDLPMPFPRFEAGLRRALRPHALKTWARSDAGRAHLLAIKAEDALADRYTLYGFGDQIRSSPCNELYVLRPRVDMPVICKALRAALALQTSSISVEDAHPQRTARGA